MFQFENESEKRARTWGKELVLEVLTLSQIKTVSFHYIHLLLLLAANTRLTKSSLARKRVWGGSCLIARLRKKFKEAFSAAEETVDEFLVR